jgi:hypothetical protein
MDHEVFDRLTRVAGVAGTRRAALGALLGGGLAGALGAADAAKNGRRRKRAGGKQGKAAARVTAEATCASPGPSANLNGCNFAGEDFSGDDLSSSGMVGTIFRNAELVGTNLSSSNMRGANFRGANLCGADLSSSVLRNADFRGFAATGRATNLTAADLRSSGGCGSILTNTRTIFCQTTMCDGSVRNDDCGSPEVEECPLVVASCQSAADCRPGEVCPYGRCVIADCQDTGPIPAAACSAPTPDPEEITEGVSRLCCNGVCAKWIDDSGNVYTVCSNR